MSLKEDKISTVFGLWTTPEMIEAHVVQRGSRSETRDVPTQFATGLVGLHDHGECIPAYQGADPPLDGGVSGAPGLMGWRNGIEICRRRPERDMGAAAPGLIDQGLKEEVGPLLAFTLDNSAQGLLPFLSL